MCQKRIPRSHAHQSEYQSTGPFLSNTSTEANHRNGFQVLLTMRIMSQCKPEAFRNQDIHAIKTLTFYGEVRSYKVYLRW